MWKTTISSEHIPLPGLSMLKTALLVCCLILTNSSLEAQRPHYVITANLDTAAHTLTGSIDITYTNLSAQPLTKLGIHLWPNAYSDRNSAFAKQMLNLGKLEFQSARISSLGGLSNLSFVSDGKNIRLDIDSANIDIAWLVLNEPLQPGQSIRCSSHYVLKIPVSFSRLGRTDDSYQLTQWYPHIAVFDEEGWHMMPYLDQGEFFNDFADYDVTIETPPGYTVASTGTIVSSPGQDKTIWKAKAENVIDFAWFASPTFRHKVFFVDVGADDPVELHLYIDSLGNEFWDSAAVYAQRALKHYSEWLGPYPYPKMSVVYAPLSKGGYMEYPMVAQMSYTEDETYLDITLAHEIGHTWLYGVLANDERSHPWMDEGLNTFIEHRYAQEFYPEYKEPYFPVGLISKISMPQYDALQHITRFNNELQPPESDPEFQIGDEYFFSAYQLPPEGLEIMMSMYGQDTMKNMFRQYFSDYKFSHVTPGKLRQSFQTTCGCDLEWFFEDWISHGHEVDYRIRKFDRDADAVTIENVGKSNIPVRISTYHDDKLTSLEWVEGFKGQKKFRLEKSADEVHLFDDFMGVNKLWRGNVKPRPLIPKIAILPKIGSYDTPILSITPFFGKNVTDGFMPGLAFTGGLLPQQHFKFVVAPMYGLESKKLRGHAEGRYIGDINDSPFDKFLLSFAVDDFGYNLDTDYLYRDHYVKWSPIIALRIEPDDHSHVLQWWQYRFVHIDQFYATGVNIGDQTFDEDHRQYGVHEISYQRTSDAVQHPYTARANIQAGQGFVRLNLRYKQQFAGRDKNHGVWIQGFGGWLPLFESTTAYVPFIINGTTSNGIYSKDYMFDEWLPGRTAAGGLAAHQVFEKDANLKSLANTGISESWMVGGGVSAALPLRYIHVYMDAALYPAGIEEKPLLSYSGGLAIVLWKDFFEIYIPILESQDILDSTVYTERNMWFERISFQANFKLANPLNFIDHDQIGY